MTVVGPTVLLLLLVAGCRTADSIPTAASAADTPLGLGPSAAPPEWFSDRGPLDDALETAVRDQLADALAVDATAVRRLGAAPVLFRDTTLGCPATSEVVTGVQTRGWVIYYELDDLLYRAHISETGRFRLCDRPELDVIPELEQ